MLDVELAEDDVESIACGVGLAAVELTSPIPAAKETGCRFIADIRE